MYWGSYRLSCLWRRWRRRSSATSNLLKIAKEFIDVFFVNLWDRDILRVILADVEANNKGKDFGQRHFCVISGEKREGKGTEMERHEITGRRLYIAHGVFTDEECEALTSFAVAPTRVPSTKSSYQRSIFTDASAGRLIFAKIGPYLPSGPMVIDEELRYNKYFVGDFIDIHIDGINVSPDKRDCFTVNIYLNDGFGGGDTVFYDKRLCEVLRVQPRAGSVVIFDPRIIHAGSVVTAGEKAIMRACVYRAAGATSR